MSGKVLNMDNTDFFQATSTSFSSEKFSQSSCPDAALIIIDVQRTFDDELFWGIRDNPHAEEHIQELIQKWEQLNMPIVMVTHSSDRLESTFHPVHDSSKLKGFLDSVQPTISITKTVNSAFYGTPDLAEWLEKENIRQVVLCGIQTNMCVETTARMSGNLGFQTTVAFDACHTFSLKDADGKMVNAASLARISAINLARGDFARVTSTERILKELANR